MVGKDLIGKFVIVRTSKPEFFAGYLLNRNGKEVELKEAFRINQWKGMAPHSELAVEGVEEPAHCNFGQRAGKLILTESIEIWECDGKAEESINLTYDHWGAPPLFGD